MNLGPGTETVRDNVWGTALQTGRSRGRSKIMPLEFSDWHNPSCRTVAPGVDSASNRNEYQECFLGGKDGRCLGLTTLPPSCVDYLEIWWVSTSWNPVGQSRRVMGLLYLYRRMRHRAWNLGASNCWNPQYLPSPCTGIEWNQTENKGSERNGSMRLMEYGFVTCHYFENRKYS
jgi:hypothetical protein